ncbi:MAG: thioredoxin family protein [Halobacteria archaeon]
MVLKESDIEELSRGESVPDFTLEGTDGDIYELDDFDEYDAVLVVFTCNHCPYAKAKFEELNYLTDNYNDLAVVGINPNDSEEYPDDSLENMRNLVDDGTVNYTEYLRDETQEVAREYGAVCTPDPYLLENTPDGFVLRYHGRIDDVLDAESDREPERYYMREAVEAVLEGDDVEFDDLPSRGCSIKWK